MIAPGTITKTRRGLPVQVVAVLPQPDANGDSIIGLLDGEITTWGADGCFRRNKPSSLDLELEVR